MIDARLRDTLTGSLGEKRKSASTAAAREAQRVEF